uniref:caspase-6-like n=1 Tax=Semicossyphus pulcher TaxID=241346 RepID=UPI0037E7BDEE
MEACLPDPLQACTENLSETDALIRSSLDLDPAEEYKMDNKRRGLALIFNMKCFKRSQKVRHGTDVDRDNLKTRLNQLNFEVKTYNNSERAEVLDIITKAAAADHSDADCFLLVFLSHGDKDNVSTYDGEISIQEITAQFKEDKCRSLVGKPKIFILQACRGGEYDDPVTPCAVNDREQETEEEVVEASAFHAVHAGPDSIMCYSVAEGYLSYRQHQKGSWFIQDLCELLQNGDSLEFTKLLTKVNWKVSMRSNDSGKKQVPCFASLLTKKLYFRPKK